METLIVLICLIVFLIWALFKQRKENIEALKEPWEYREGSSSGPLYKKPESE